jgi:MAC/Perforin domain
MTKCSLLVILAIVVACACVTANAEVKKVPNLDAFVGRGYNIFMANPASTFGNADPGYRKFNILNRDYGAGNTTKWGQYTIPHGYDLVPGTKVIVSEAAAMTNTANAYSRTLAERTSFSAGKSSNSSVSGEFSMSDDYQLVNAAWQQSSSVTFLSQSFCKVWTVRLIDESHGKRFPSLTDEFRARVNALPSGAFKPDDYYGFLYEWGTHYVSSTQFGSEAGSMSTLSASQYIGWSSSTSSVERAASLATQLSFGLTLSRGAEQDAQQYQKEAGGSLQTIVLGRAVPPSGSINVWIEQTQSDPYPLALQLVNISSLLTQLHFPGDADIDQKRVHVERAFATFCANATGCTPTPPVQYCASPSLGANVLVSASTPAVAGLGYAPGTLLSFSCKAGYRSSSASASKLMCNARQQWIDASGSVASPLSCDDGRYVYVYTSKANACSGGTCANACLTNLMGSSTAFDPCLGATEPSTSDQIWRLADTPGQPGYFMLCNTAAPAALEMFNVNHEPGLYRVRANAACQLPSNPSDSLFRSLNWKLYASSSRNSNFLASMVGTNNANPTGWIMNNCGNTPCKLSGGSQPCGTCGKNINACNGAKDNECGIQIVDVPNLQ